jgi:hypothetical protein
MREAALHPLSLSGRNAKLLVSSAIEKDDNMQLTFTYSKPLCLYNTPPGTVCESFW